MICGVVAQQAMIVTGPPTGGPCDDYLRPPFGAVITDLDVATHSGPAVQPIETNLCNEAK